MVRAILEQKTLSIDAYHENTQDKALSRGHYYSDKAPGLALLAFPIAAAADLCCVWWVLIQASPRGLVAISYAATLFAGGPAHCLGLCVSLSDRIATREQRERRVLCISGAWAWQRRCGLTQPFSGDTPRRGLLDFRVSAAVVCARATAG